MAIVDYAGMIVQCLSSDGKPVRPDGWTLSWIDTGEQFFHRDGAWELMGLGYSFAPPTKSGRITTDANGLYSVVFSTGFVDDLYSVALSCQDIGTKKAQPMAFKKDITATGFTIQTRDTQKGDPMPNIIVSWVATRMHND
jgi:hypothetical protein